jgi:hypothetical protein
MNNDWRSLPFNQLDVSIAKESFPIMLYRLNLGEGEIRQRELKRFVGWSILFLLDCCTQLEIKGGNPLKISGKGGTSGKHRRN